VYYSEDDNVVVVYPIDDAVILKYQFAEVMLTNFGDHSTQEWLVTQLSAASMILFAKIGAKSRDWRPMYCAT